MPEGKKKSKRKALSQKIRFEVFKRDRFTCQYCGRKAPDVVLQVDHIIPVSKGGKNDIINLVTSCVDCNAGKRDRKLDDASVIEKQRREMELRQERLEQIRMIGEWQASLMSIEEAELAEVDKLFNILSGGEYHIKREYLTGPVLKTVKKFGLATVLEALRKGTSGYGGNAEKALQHIGGICANMSDPLKDMTSRVFCAVKNKFYNVRDWEIRKILIEGRESGGMGFLKAALALVYELPSRGWGSVSDDFYELVRNWSEETF